DFNVTGVQTCALPILNLNLGGTLDITSNWNAEIDYSFSNQEFIHLQPGTHFTARDINVNGGLRYDEEGNAVYVNRDGEVVSSSRSEERRVGTAWRAER